MPGYSSQKYLAVFSESRFFLLNRIHLRSAAPPARKGCAQSSQRKIIGGFGMGLLVGFYSGLCVAHHRETDVHRPLTSADPKNTTTLMNSQQAARSRTKPSASCSTSITQTLLSLAPLCRGHARSSKALTPFAAPGCANCSQKRFEHQCRGSTLQKMEEFGGKAVVHHSLWSFKWVSALSAQTPV